MRNTQQQNHRKSQLPIHSTNFQYNNNNIPSSNVNQNSQLHHQYQYPQKPCYNYYHNNNNGYMQNYYYQQHSSNQRGENHYNQQQNTRNWTNFNNHTNQYQNTHNQYNNRQQSFQHYNNEQHGQQWQQQANMYQHQDYYNCLNMQQWPQHQYQQPNQQLNQQQNQQRTQHNNNSEYFQRSLTPSIHNNSNFITTGSRDKVKTNESKGQVKYSPQQDPRSKFKKDEKQNEKIKRQHKEISNKQQKKQFTDESDSDKSEISQDQEQLYQKTKNITKKRDVILDSPEEIQKWITLRKKNYPRANRSKTDNEKAAQEMSLLELKIRKKIMFLTTDRRGLTKKLKNMHILKRLIADQKIQRPKRRRRENRQREEQVRRIKQRKQQKNQNTKIRKQEQEKAISQNKQQQQDSQDGQKSNEQPIQIPIHRETPTSAFNSNLEQKQVNSEQLEITNFHNGQKIPGLTPQNMINHLRQKQSEDQQFYDQLFNYRSNSLNYKYNSLTLETNFLLEDIFQESSYLLQIIRYIVKNNFFDAE